MPKTPQTHPQSPESLFLSQSSQDAWEDYIRSLNNESFICWDYIILTASNDHQAEGFQKQIARRQASGSLPTRTRFHVLPDPEGKRVGSGGATLGVLKFLAEDAGTTNFKNLRVLVIHSGGDSKRIPQYSALGKLFSPVPHVLPNGRPSTLFDEFMVAMSSVPSRIREGMLLLSGDVLLLFNPLQIDFPGEGAAAISFKEDVATGKNHGVYLRGEDGYVAEFLHKQTEESLNAKGAVNSHGRVDIDTGAVIFSTGIMQALYSLVQEDEKKYINEKVRLSLYGDFQYPLASSSTLEQFYQEKPEGEYCSELREARKAVWDRLRPFRMRLLCLAPAKFVHFGTTQEILKLMATGVEGYRDLGWSRVVGSSIADSPAAGYMSALSSAAECGEDVYLEVSNVGPGAKVGSRSILSFVDITDETMPEDVVVHALKQRDGRFAVRIYGTGDNPKAGKDGSFLGTTLEGFLQANGLEDADLWGSVPQTGSTQAKAAQTKSTQTGDSQAGAAQTEEPQTDAAQKGCAQASAAHIENAQDSSAPADSPHTLWTARLYPVCTNIQEAVKAALNVHAMARGQGDVDAWKASARTSLQSGFHDADPDALIAWEERMDELVRMDMLGKLIRAGKAVSEIKGLFCQKALTPIQREWLETRLAPAEFGDRMRFCYYIGKLLGGAEGERYISQCFHVIQGAILEATAGQPGNATHCSICRDEHTVRLPLRLNWGGGWSDTPPYCNEHGGTVLNAAVLLDSGMPVMARLKRLEERKIVLASADMGIYGEFHRLEELQDVGDPYDPYVLQKAALLACGVIPARRGVADAAPHQGGTLDAVLARLGGGFRMDTEVSGVPKGSGLGTSSILAAACVKALSGFLGIAYTEKDIYCRVLAMEQMMSTGGGWQDQVGGMTEGIKFITTRPGLRQDIHVEHVALQEETRQELNDRLVLIYTGQRRLARNLLRDVVGRYIGNEPEALEALEEIQRTAALMRFELERGHIDDFAHLLSRHWELSKQLDAGSSNTLIEQIFGAVDDMLEGKMICGAGGGGFLQAIMKKGVTRDMVHRKLKDVFQDTQVGVWNCELI